MRIHQSRGDQLQVRKMIKEVLNRGGGGSTPAGTRKVSEWASLF
jgi:hypothetical protein